MSAPQGAGEAEKNIEIWKVKKLIKRLEAARGNGTSMISLIIRKLDNAAQVVVCPANSALQLQRIRSREQRRCWLKNSYVTYILMLRSV